MVMAGIIGHPPLSKVPTMIFYHKSEPTIERIEKVTKFTTQLGLVPVTRNLLPNVLYFGPEKCLK